MASNINPFPLSLEQSAGLPLHKGHLSVSASPLLAQTTHVGPQPSGLRCPGQGFGAIYCQLQQSAICAQLKPCGMSKRLARKVKLWVRFQVCTRLKKQDATPIAGGSQKLGRKQNICSFILTCRL